MTALVEDISGRVLPGSKPPPDWGPCVLGYRGRVRMDPVVSGVPRTRERHGGLCLYPPLATAIIEWGAKMERSMLAGDPLHIFPWPLPAAYIGDPVGTYPVSL